MRRFEHLIRQIRRQSDNLQIGDDDGINTEEILQYLSDAQETIQGRIIRAHKTAFYQDYITSSVKNQEFYELPSHVWMDASIVHVDYSDNGNSKDYRPLDYVQRTERRSVPGTPVQYTVYGNRLVLSPIPETTTSNAIRVTYNPHLPKPDIRRSTVASVTQAAGSVSAITLDNGFSTWNTDDWLEDDYLTVVDKGGSVLAKAIGYSAVAASGVVTLAPNPHVLSTGESITVGDYVCRGQNSSTNSGLSDMCEKWLIQYAVQRVISRDSSQDVQIETPMMTMMLEDIIANYGTLSEDFIQIPLINDEYF